MVVLGIPVISRPDLLRACLESIDLEVQLVVIDNSGTGEFGDIAAEYGALVVEPATNLGVAASWNHIIRSFPDEPYWLIANADTVLGAGDLQRLCDEPGGWVGVNDDWRAFRIEAGTIHVVGFFDENYHPIYCEDADYERRCDLAGIDWHFISGGSTHAGSATIQEPRYRDANARTYPSNVAYYETKWGVGVRMPGGYLSPFDRGGHVGDWRLDLSRLRANSW